MADFEVVIRSSYRDVGGLVLDCSAGDYALDSSGAIARWNNRAPAGGPHFGDLAQGTVAEMPAANADGSLKFTRANPSWLVGPSLGDFGGDSQNWAFAFEFLNSAITTNSQLLFGANEATRDFAVYRRLVGNQAIFTDAVVASAAGQIGDGASVVSFNPAGTIDLYTQGAAVISGATMSAFHFPPNTEFAFNVGRRRGGGDYLDGSLYGLKAWRKMLSPLERDLAFATVRADGTSVGVYARFVTSLKAWHDGTGSPAARQNDRLRPRVGAPHLFALAKGVAGARVQFACEQGGLALDDTQLGGNLYALAIVERAGPVTFSQDAGWSSVFDAAFYRSGHYTLLFDRPSHGGRVVHLDVELG